MTVVVVAVLSPSGAGATGRSLALTGQLTVPGMGLGPGLGLGQVAVSGATAVVGTDGSEAYVFDRGPLGWSSGVSSARLRAVSSSPLAELGAFNGSVAVGDGVVVATARSGPGFATAAFVFVRPPSGWARVINQSAELTASSRSGCSSLFDVAVAQRAILVSCGSTSSQAAVLVFREPSSGWSGQLHESAELVGPRGGSLPTGARVATSGRIVVTDGYTSGPSRGAVFVYREPTGGWYGRVAPIASLTARNGAFLDAVAVAGRSIFATGATSKLDRQGRASIYGFTEPQRGWHGTLHQTSDLRYPWIDSSCCESLAASDRVVSVSYGTLGSGHSCPCRGTVASFVAGRHSWSGVQTKPALITLDSESGATPLAIQNTTIFASGGSAVQLLTPR